MNTATAKKLIVYRRMVDALMGNGCADMVLRGGEIINVLTREIYAGDVAVKGGYIMLTGDCSSLVSDKTEVIDVRGKYLCPGFIDSHMHFESSMLTETEFSRLSIPSGTTALVADPHEIANVSGAQGIFAMLEEARGLPNHVFLTVPCLTPDVPGLETPGAELGSKDIPDLLRHENTLGIGEMQGFSNPKSVYEHAPELIDDLLASAFASRQAGKSVEGNAPSLFGAELAAHILVCGGRTSCHETTSKGECVEKLRQGVTVFMREGSTQRNMAECIKAVTEDGLDSRGLVLATDDMVAADLLKSGHMNEVIRRTVACGVDPVEAIQMATINAAAHYGLDELGVIAPGKAADIVVLDDLRTIRPAMVILGGKLAAVDGTLRLGLKPFSYPEGLHHSVRCRKMKASDLAVKARGKTSAKVRGIAVVPDQNLTEEFEQTLAVSDGVVAPSPESDALPLVVAERHGKSDRIGRTFVRGLGIKRGAVALSVAHDAHNIIAAGANYDDMAMAVNRVAAMDGGIALICDGKVCGNLPLPVSGLITDRMNGEEVCERLEKLEKTAREELGCTLHAPFMHLSFLSLVTSPKLKLTDYGLIDTERYKVVSTFTE